jgi:hypothetical protein
MSRLSTRVERLGGGKRCPVCLQPGPLYGDVKIRTNITTLTEEDVKAIKAGTYVPPPPREPERCEECGRPTEIIIRMKGLNEKSRGDAS